MSDDPQTRRNFLAAANEKLKSKFVQKPKTAEDVLIDKAQQITSALREQIRPILQAGGFTDKQALRAVIAQLYLEAFNLAFSKDELLNLCVILHMEIMMESIEANPWGNDKPDAFSGV